MARISKRTVDDMTPPESSRSRVYLWDDRLKGFGVMATATGSKSYIVQYRLPGPESKTRRVTIGRHGAPWTPEKARDRACEVLEQVRRKIDPYEADKARLADIRVSKQLAAEEDRVRERLGFSTYADQFLDRYARLRQKARTFHETNNIFSRDLRPAFGTTPISMIMPRDILAFTEKLYDRSPSAALKAHRTLSKFFSWAASRHDVSDNPMRNLKPPHIQPSRDRVLNDDELTLVWRAAERIGYPYGSLIQTLVLTGQRLQEVSAMEWEEVDLEQAVWVIPGKRTKNGKPSVVPLAEVAIAILKSIPKRGRHVFTTNGRAPFSGFSKSKKRLDAAMRVEAPTGINGESWRVHDIRRTMATGLQRLGVRLEVTEAVLNHVSGSRAGIVGIYQKYDYAVEKRQALMAWGSHVEQCARSASIEK